MSQFTLETPWDHADQHKELGRGVMQVWTPGHGGLFVPEELLHHVSQEGRDYARRWSGSEQWYEEDSAWAYVALAFPDLFTPRDLELARKTILWIKERNRGRQTAGGR